MDPDCCIHSTCQGQIYCRGAPDPSTMQHPSSPSPDVQGFYQRVSFLVAPGGTHTLPGENTFNSRLGALERLRNSQLNLELGNRLVTYASLHKSYCWTYMWDGAVVNKHVMKSYTQSIFPSIVNIYLSVGLMAKLFSPCFAHWSQCPTIQSLLEVRNHFLVTAFLLAANSILKVLVFHQHNELLSYPDKL